MPNYLRMALNYKLDGLPSQSDETILRHAEHAERVGSHDVAAEWREEIERRERRRRWVA